MSTPHRFGRALRRDRQTIDHAMHTARTTIDHTLAGLERQLRDLHHHASVPLPIRGCDYAYGRPAPATLRASGLHFAARYYGGSPDKDLTRSEARELSSGGVYIVSAWESSGTEALGGEQAGQRVGELAGKQAHQIGQPAGSPIFFAVDFDVLPSQLSTVEAYIRGASVALEAHRYHAGAYGSYLLCEHLAAAGVHWLWQTSAWSNGLWSRHAQLRQAGAKTIEGVQLDLDESVAVNYGGWKL